MVDVKFLIQPHYSRYYVVEFDEGSWVQHYIRKDGTVGNYTELTQKPDLYCWETKEKAQRFARLLKPREILAQEIREISLELHNAQTDQKSVEKEIKAMSAKTTIKKGDKFQSGLGNKYIIIEGDKAVIYESDDPKMVGNIYPATTFLRIDDWYQPIR